MNEVVSNSHDKPAIDTLEGKSEVSDELDGNYKDRTNAIKKCYEATKKLGTEPGIFALQNGGECRSSRDAWLRYGIYGPSQRCKEGKGGPLANDVYRITNSKPE